MKVLTFGLLNTISMKKVKIAPLMLLAYFLSPLFVSAQTDYVVTANNDTIQGKVKYLNYGTSKSVQVVTPDKKKATYPILQTKAFKYDNETGNFLKFRNAKSAEKCFLHWADNK